MIAWLRTLLFFIGWVSATLLMGVLALPVLISQRATQSVGNLWVKLTLIWLRIACGISSQVRGKEYIPTGSGLIAARHESAWDTLVLWQTLKNPAFVLKRELYWIPIYGWYLKRTGQIAIDRKASTAALRLMLAGAERMKNEGRSIVIFPEGTRQRAGEQTAFHAGVARLSAALQLPVTPVVLNSGKFWPKHTLKKSPGTAVVEFLPAQPAFTGENLESWMSQLQQTVQTRSAQL